VLERHAGSVEPLGSVDEALRWDAWARNEASGIVVAQNDSRRRAGV
jgi:hypothetical protein